ncbi:MAG: hypothetical protein M5U26_06565 [Planctomycetota bacterium]|nr:hypothetical protein [Planctomycetota bacterium]
MYKSYLEIKALKKSLDGQSIPKEAIEPLERHLETRLEEEFKKESEAIIKRLYSGQNEPRRNELINMMAIALKRLAKMVDHGGTIDVAGELTNEPSAEPATNSGSPEDRAKFEEKRRLFGIAAVVREHGNAIGTLEDRSKPQLALPDIQQPNENEGSKV